MARQAGTESVLRVPGTPRRASGRILHRWRRRLGSPGARRASMLSIRVLRSKYGEDVLSCAGSLGVYRDLATLYRSLNELRIVL